MRCVCVVVGLGLELGFGLGFDSHTLTDIPHFLRTRQRAASPSRKSGPVALRPPRPPTPATTPPPPPPPPSTCCCTCPSTQTTPTPCALPLCSPCSTLPRPPPQWHAGCSRAGGWCWASRWSSLGGRRRRSGRGGRRRGGCGWRAVSPRGEKGRAVQSIRLQPPPPTATTGPSLPPHPNLHSGHQRRRRRRHGGGDEPALRRRSPRAHRARRRLCAPVPVPVRLPQRQAARRVGHDDSRRGDGGVLGRADCGAEGGLGMGDIRACVCPWIQ